MIGRPRPGKFGNRGIARGLGHPARQVIIGLKKPYGGHLSNGMPLPGLKQVPRFDPTLYRVEIPGKPGLAKSAIVLFFILERKVLLDQTAVTMGNQSLYPTRYYVELGVDARV